MLNPLFSILAIATLSALVLTISFFISCQFNSRFAEILSEVLLILDFISLASIFVVLMLFVVYSIPHLFNIL